MSRTDKRDEILRAAMELIAEFGFHGTPMSLVARRAGVAVGTIYCYFANKDELILAAHARLENQLLAVLTEDYPAGSPLRERFVHIGCKLVEYFISAPMDFRFMEQFFNSPYGVAHRREKLFGRKESIIYSLFDEALERQVVKDFPPPLLCALAFGPLADICRDHILEFIALDKALIERTVAACWDAVRR